MVHRMDIHDKMFNKVKNHCGVHVHWSVYHSGKSTSGRVIASMLWNIGRGVKFIKARSDLTEHSFEFVLITMNKIFFSTRACSRAEDKASAENWMKRVLGFTADEDDRLCVNECFAKYCVDQTEHASIIIDEADAILGFNGWEELIRNLAHGSWDDK